jgi:large subunit ribosomal protein L24e
MVNCSFCGKAISRGTGKMFVKVDGKILYFCSNKCEKNNNKLGRKARETGWTEEFKRFKQGGKND